MTKSEQEKQRLQDAVARLMEHFDTVQIFATRHDNEAGGTINVEAGNGNWFARYGQVHRWMAEQDLKDDLNE